LNLQYYLWVQNTLKWAKTQVMNSQQEYHQLFNTKPLIPYLQVVEYNQRQHIFDLIVAENIEYRYLNGSCEESGTLPQLDSLYFPMNCFV
jgi:hypothetical protein